MSQFRMYFDFTSFLFAQHVCCRLLIRKENTKHWSVEMMIYWGLHQGPLNFDLLLKWMTVQHIHLHACGAYLTHVHRNTQRSAHCAFISVLDIFFSVIIIALTASTSSTEVQDSSRPSMMSGTTHYYVFTFMTDCCCRCQSKIRHKISQMDLPGIVVPDA